MNKKAKKNKSTPRLTESKIPEEPGGNPSAVTPSNRFNRSFRQLVDKRFLGILTGSVILHIVLVVYFLLNPLSEDFTMRSIANIQKELAQSIKEREALKDQQYVQFKFNEKKPDGFARGTNKRVAKSKPRQAGTLKVSKKKIKKAVAQNKGLAKSRRRTRRRRSRSRAGIAAVVGKKGVLAVLASTSSVATGSEVADLLGHSQQISSDLDKAMSRISSLSRGRRSYDRDQERGTVRGDRSSGEASIDGLVSELGEANSQSFERSGELAIASSNLLIEGGDGSGGILGRRQENIQAIVLKHNKSVQHCYERQLKRNPTLRGKITVRFTISPRGAVTKVELLSSTLGNRKVERCILSRIRRWNDFGEVDDSYGSTTIRQSYAFGY